MRYFGGGVGHIAQTSALPADDGPDVEQKIPAPPSHRATSPAAVPNNTEATDAQQADEHDESGSESEDDSDMEPPTMGDLDDSSSDEDDGEGSDGAYDDRGPEDHGFGPL
jgi:hypothetical protein